MPIEMPTPSYEDNIKMYRKDRGLSWIRVAQIAFQWRTLADMVVQLNFLFHKRRGISGIAERLSASKK
jgi:hypothetical protein